MFFTDCNVRLANGLGLPQPLYLRPDNGQFMLPQTSAGIVQVGSSRVINVHCPGGFQGRFQSHRNRTLAAACVSGVQFTAANTQFQFNELRCVRAPPHQIRRTTQRCPGGQIAEVGFTVESRFLR